MIDEEKLKRLLKEKYESSVPRGNDYMFCQLKPVFLSLIKKSRVPMKSPEEIEGAINRFVNHWWEIHRETSGTGNTLEMQFANLLRAVLNQPQETWHEKIFEKEEKPSEDTQGS